MNYLAIFFTSFVIAFSGALAPGPLLAYVVGESARSGAKTGFLVILGHMFLEAAMVAVIVFGLAAYVTSQKVLNFISAAGGLTLICSGSLMLKSLKGLSLGTPKRQAGGAKLPIMGIVMSMSNPYWTIWWLTIGLGLVLGAFKTGIFGVAAFFTGHILADFLWYSAVSCAVSRGKGLISLKTYKIIFFTCSMSLIGFGAWFILKVL